MKEKFIRGFAYYKDKLSDFLFKILLNEIGTVFRIYNLDQKFEITIK